MTRALLALQRLPGAERVQPQSRAGWIDALPWMGLGLIVGVSFLAQPVKFLTPGLDRTQLIAVGSVIFHASHAVQWALCLLLCSLLPQRKARPAIAWLCLAPLGALLALQQFWLLPTLDERLRLMQAGQMPPASLHHVIYIGLELLKLSALLALARQPAQPTAPH